MSNIVKLIIDIPKDDFKKLVNPYQHNEIWCERLKRIVLHGIPLNNFSEQTEIQTYLAGHIKGWEQGREDLIDEILNKVSEIPTSERDGSWVKNDVYRVLEEIIKKE